MIPETTIKINEVEYKVKRTNRSLLEFEKLTKKSIEEISANLTDMLGIFYSILKANNQHFNFTFEDFVDYLDEYDEEGIAFDMFKDYILSLVNDGAETNKKKVTRKK